jgi:hypothetical protein
MVFQGSTSHRPRQLSLADMLTEEITVKLKPVVRFREFPFGISSDPSLREFMATEPWENQDNVLSYLRSGLILAYPMGADLMD